MQTCKVGYFLEDEVHSDALRHAGNRLSVMGPVQPLLNVH